MQETQLWQRLEWAVAPEPARVWANHVVLSDLGERTVMEALQSSYTYREIWFAVCRYLDIPENVR